MKTLISITARDPSELKKTQLMRVAEEINRIDGRQASILIAINSETDTQFDVAGLEIEHLELNRVRVLFVDDVGIPAVRNATLAWAIEREYENLIFLDSDVVPRENWLSALMNEAALGNSDAVFSTVNKKPVGAKSSFLPRTYWSPMDYGEEEYLINGQTVTQIGFTNSCLIQISKPAFKSLGTPWFLEFFPGSGGSDLVFFSNLRKAGGTLVRCTQSVADEIYDADRLRLVWHVRRKVRDAVNYVEYARAGFPPRANDLRKRALAEFRSIGYEILAARSLLDFLAKGIGGLVLVLAGGAGLVLGLFSVRPKYYSVDHDQVAPRKPVVESGE